jgi:hypothetical protein
VLIERVIEKINQARIKRRQHLITLKKETKTIIIIIKVLNKYNIIIVMNNKFRRTRSVEPSLQLSKRNLSTN